MGGMIAQELALAHPERIRTLTIGASYCGGPEGTLMAPEDLQMLGAAYVSGEPEQVFRAMWEINLSPELPRGRLALRRLHRDGLGAARAAAGRPAADARLRRPRHHERLGQISLPTLVIHGDADRLLGYANGREIAASDPGARLETLEGVGHMFWWEQPQRSAELIREHALTPV